MSASRFHLYIPLSQAPAASVSVRIVDSSLRWGLAIFAFVLPIFVIPLGSRGAEFWKQESLLIGTGILLLLWIVKSALARAVHVRNTSVGLWAWAFLFAAALAAISAPSLRGGMFGASGEIGPLATVLALVLWYAIVANTVASARDIRRIFLALEGAALTAGLVGLLAFFGIRFMGLLVPPEESASWMSSGAPFVLGTFLAAMLLAAPAVLSLPPFRGALSSAAMRSLVMGSALISVAYLAVLDSWIMWVSLLLGMGTLLFIVPFRLQDGDEPRRFLIPMIPATLALWLIFARLPFIEAPAEPPSRWLAVVSAFRSFGHGLPSWEMVASGVFMAFIAVTLVASGRRILRAYSWSAPAAIFAAAVALAVIFLLGPAGIAPQFLFWTFAALLASGSAVPQKYALNAKYGAAVVAMLVIAAGISLTFVFGGATRALAAVEEARARSALARGEDELARRRLRRATQFVWYEDSIARLNVEALLQQLRKTSEVDSVSVGELVQAAITSAQRATRLDSANAENWRTLASVYRALSRAVPGAGFAAIKAGERAVILDPTDAGTATDVARDRRLVAEQLLQTGKDDLAKEFLKGAEDDLGRALEIAPEYGQALFELALTYDRQGRQREAISWMEKAQGYYPWDVGVAFELGKMYAEAGRDKDAEDQFQRAIRMVPSFANARWFLANLYVKQGKLKDANNELTYIARLDPGNKFVLGQLEALRRRLAAKR